MNMAGNNLNQSANSRCDDKSLIEDYSSCDSQRDELPIVFQCAKCNNIIGDSLSWVTADEEMRTITISRVVDPVLKKEMVTSVSGKDRGSTYETLLCKSCQAAIGKVYRTTTRELDSIRDLYTLNIDVVKSYSIGQAGTNSEANTSTDDFLSIPSAKYLHLQQRKMQQVVLTLTTRVSALESGLSEEFQACSKRKRRDVFN